MRVICHPKIGASGTPIVLGDDAKREFIADFTKDEGRLVQVSQPVRATHARVFARENRQTNVTFATHRQHASKEAAYEFDLVHPEKVPTAGVIELIQESSTGVTRRWMRNAVIQRVASRIIGKETIHSYAITGGAFLVDRPKS